VGTRYEIRDFRASDLDAAARLRAADHARHRAAMPALDAAYADPATMREQIESILDRDGAGVFVTRGDEPAAYILAVQREGASWGANAWTDAAGVGGDDRQALREGYAAAAARWVADGRTQHYVVVNASDGAQLDAWFSLSFGIQHVHAVREPAPADYRPANTPGILVRPIERRDLPQTAQLGQVLPRHVAQSPVFSYVPIETVEEALAEAEADFGDPRYTEFVAEYDGRIVGITVACALSESPGNTPLMRPRNAGLLGHAAVDPDARGLGVGRALGERVLAWSRDAGHDWIGADWRSTNLEADRTWRALGFRPTFYRLHRSVI
jgi:GNAT superfamily N-acetyltransferase